MSLGPESNPVVFLADSIKTPPFTGSGPSEAGAALRQIHDGVAVTLPASRPMPSIGSGVHELSIRDAGHNWRVVYRIDPDAILVVAVFAKTTRATPGRVIERCRRRLKGHDA